ncbi:hypothetical protein AOQ84DRAFT_389576 [Glonium stellatum]|uniref:Uncharacterized protein n=1 Tax=Glonium stellatum TaxID=574774 RepID=A0A8E2JRV7_9PEZI|nr:hypothetical protein AOQ84DRAFT_389576 [Glonium stellatum]
MSGNPFRISLHQQQQPAINPTSTLPTPNAPSGRADAPEQPIDTVSPSPTPLRTKRTVRIESPASSPPQPGFPDPEHVLLQRLSRGGHIGSLPPASPTSSSDSDEESLGDPFGRDADGDRDGNENDELVRNTRTNSAMGERASGSRSTTVPANPFQKTLATMEPSVKTATLHREALSDRPAPERLGPGPKRASLDVDAFKRLLLTGSPNPSGSGTSSQPVPQNSISGAILESSSSTDTSSISRQSIFEPIQETHAESPRTSYETTGGSDDEAASLMAESRKAEKKIPPPPKHRHGKFVTSRTPQTVSFADFSPSFAVTSQHPSSPGASTSPRHNRTNSDLNKPLPPPPVASSPPSEPQERIQKEPILQQSPIEYRSNDTARSDPQQPRTDREATPP